MMGSPLAYLGEQLATWRKAGTSQPLRVLESERAPESTFDGREVINLASNNYLGLTTHPKLREAALEATRKYGVGSGAVRTISGTMSIHMQLEERIAKFKNVEASVVFQSGFAANSGTVAAILGPEDHIVSDALNHASIIDGCRLSRAKIHVFRHRDAAHAEEVLATLDDQPGHKLLITDGVFSMDGDIGPLPGLTDAAERHGAMMMVGDASAAHGCSRALFEEGLYTTGIGFPTVPEGKARIRTIVTATHSRDVLERAVGILAKVAKRLTIL